MEAIQEKAKSSEQQNQIQLQEAQIKAATAAATATATVTKENIDLPEITGQQLWARLRERRPNAKVLFISADTEKKIFKSWP